MMRWCIIKITQTKDGRIKHEVFGPYVTRQAAEKAIPAHDANMIFYVSTFRRL